MEAASEAQTCTEGHTFLQNSQPKSIVNWKNNSKSKCGHSQPPRPSAKQRACLRRDTPHCRWATQVTVLAEGGHGGPQTRDPVHSSGLSPTQAGCPSVRRGQTEERLRRDPCHPGRDKRERARVERHSHEHATHTRSMAAAVTTRIIRPPSQGGWAPGVSGVTGKRDGSPRLQTRVLLCSSTWFT